MVGAEGATECFAYVGGAEGRGELEDGGDEEGGWICGGGGGGGRGVVGWSVGEAGGDGCG